LKFAASVCQSGEPIGVQAFIAESAIERLDVTVLHGAAGIDIAVIVQT